VDHAVKCLVLVTICVCWFVYKYHMLVLVGVQFKCNESERHIVTALLSNHSHTCINKLTNCFPLPLCRQDGKDSLKFYTEPGYFFELWCQAMQKDAARNQMRRNKRQRRPPVNIFLICGNNFVNRMKRDQ
jgi:hypothetical protein